ncbi:putative beta-glucosidase [Pedobacter sp. BAL39]|uniref:glycoside hydrolase family 3 N-terminal domain-containing protein n=1 Tax=Pedobacter sp. BAL39 TaxID=391596 RepID=UPI000155AF66|nr:glycoside hydrolase family 3 N-terminal domain-containing protein [Pedobacter sp. BAL39]EDM34591.1 putative beta-glucosidase [Pedobacter sp. BAL39]
MKRTYSYILALAFLCLSSSAFAQKKTAEKKPVYKNPSFSTEERVKDLIGRMTLEEKVGQLSTLLGWDMYTKTNNQISASETFKKAVAEQHTGLLWATLRADPWTKKTLLTGLNPMQSAMATNALQKYVMEHTRLGIPMLFSEECPHGHMAIGTTVFPTSIGQSSTWDPALIKEMAAAIAMETRLQGGHIGYGPVLDLAREPRWSRVEETYGEDPVLNSRMGEAMVSGFQGTNIGSGVNILSTLKHFTAYGVPEGGHNGGSVTVGNRELFQSYLPPFKAAVKAGALSVMTAYNSVDGIPCSSNRYLLTDILRGQWGFNGFVVSDLNSISGLEGNHHVASSATEAAALAMNAGLDADLSGYGYGPALVKAVNGGLVKMATVDTALARVLRLKFNMGLFENPYVNPKQAEKQVMNAKHVTLARKVAQESVVLLKNEKNILPLSKALKNIAVIGPNADNVYNQLGDYTAPQADGKVITVLNGIRAKVSKETGVFYQKGCAIRDTASAGIAAAVALASKSDVAIVVLGGSSARDFKTEYQNTGAAEVKASAVAVSDMESGEGFDRSTLDLMGRQMELLRAVVKTGTPVVVVLIKGRPLTLNWAAENVAAMVDAWYPGQEGGNAIADVLFGDYNPAGRLSVSVPKSVGQLPVYYNKKRPLPHNYVELDEQPLYSFGYGLSYSTFEYSNLKTNVSGRGKDVRVQVTFDLKNTGSRDGDEVVQLYLRDEQSSVVTPMQQLKQFRRLSLKSGQQQQLSFELSAEDLQLMNQQMEWQVEPGDFSLMVGASSSDIRLKKVFSVQ